VVHEGDRPVAVGGHHAVADTGQGDLEPVVLPIELLLGRLALALDFRTLSGHRESYVEKFAGEGFREIVVRTGVENRLQTLGRVACSDDQDLLLIAAGLSAQPATELEAVHSGHVPVENDEGKELPLASFPGEPAVEEGGGLVAVVEDRFFQLAEGDRIVVHHEDFQSVRDGDPSRVGDRAHCRLRAYRSSFSHV